MLPYSLGCNQLLPYPAAGDGNNDPGKGTLRRVLTAWCSSRRAAASGGRSESFRPELQPEQHHPSAAQTVNTPSINNMGAQVDYPFWRRIIKAMLRK